MNSKFPDWSGQTTVILASGPSLTAEQISHACQADVNIIAVNSTAFNVPLPDVIYAGDMMWWKRHHQGAVHGARWTCERATAERYGLNFIKGVNALGLSTSPRYIHTNGNSGAQAINLAYLFGSRRILLLGFDMKLGPNGEKHHHPDHPAPMVQSQTFSDWIHKLNFLARDLEKAGCEIINCTPGSVLSCFPRSTIEKELPCNPLQ